MSIPYEGQLLYALAENFRLKGSEMLDISLGMQIIGLVLGGIFIRTIKAARNILKYALPVCVLGTVTFFFPSYTVWMISLIVCSTLAGVCITASGQFIRICITYENRFRTAALMLINISVLKMVINNIALLISVQAAAAFTMIVLAAAWLLTVKAGFKDSKTSERQFNKKSGIKALVLLFLFIAIISIDFGIMTQVVNPKYDSSAFSSWYWLLPYVGAATIMMRLRNSEDRGTMLYVAVGLIGLGFLLSLTLDYSVISFLIVNTVMMGAWAISDVFWWSILVEMLEMVKNHAVILSVGFSGVMIGVLAGKLIAGNDLTISNTSLSIVTMAVICITLIILPMLQKLLSMMIKKNSEDITSELNTERGDAGSQESPRAYWDDSMLNFPKDADALTEREKQIAALLLKGRTYKLIAQELFLSENTVKTHVKNIYSKLGIKRKSELFNFIMK
ncbi:MAG: response regulator transcription factor [Burkholderiales bacterium]